MSLQGNTQEEQIYRYLLGIYKNPFGVCGLMGNIKAESNLQPKNLQNSYEKSLGFTDDTYTAAVDSGKYTNFVHDKAGYGLCQWTYYSRKQNMLNFHKSKGKSIGDLETQLEFLMQELTTGYKSVHSALMTAKSVKEASDVVLHQFEKPAKQDATVENNRAAMGQEFYNKFASIIASSGAATSTPAPSASTNKGGNSMGSSSLVDCTMLSPNHSGQRTQPLTRLTPHCVVGQTTAERIGEIFKPTSRQASCNYGIGLDGRVCLIVDENNRSWCTSNADNDQRAITFEIASDTTHPYAMKEVAYEKFIALSIDICRRHGKKKLLWFGDKAKTLAYKPAADEFVLTVHRWFAQKACPGDWLYNRLGEVATRVTAALGGATPAPAPAAPQPAPAPQPVQSSSSTKKEMYYVRKSWADKASQIGAYSVLDNAKRSADSKPGFSVFNSAGQVVYSKTAAPTATPSAPTASGKKVPYTVQVDITDLKIRKGPGTNYGTNGYTGIGRFTIVDESAGAGSKAGWGKLKSGVGWISLDFAKKV